MLKNAQPSAGEMHSQDVIWALLFHELARVQRYAMPLALLRLKTSSPQLSKLQGADGIKRIIIQTLKTQLRQVDMAGQYQNDYLIVLPVTDELGATLVARRLVTTLYGVHPYRYGKTLQINPFIGIATAAPKAILSIDNFVEQATVALREAFTRSPGAIVPYSELASSTPEPQPAPDTPTPQ